VERRSLSSPEKEGFGKKSEIDPQSSLILRIPNQSRKNTGTEKDWYPSRA
jgi:hypothetical protein